MTTLRIAEDLELPLDIITGRTGINGTSGSGKSYTGMKLAELALEAGAQIIAIDNPGVWYGLKVGKDSKTAGLPIPVFGGIHQDLPLRPESGRVMAQVLARSRASAVIDCSEFMPEQLTEFVADFAEEFFEAKKKNKSPVLIFWEEAQSVCPQELPPEKHAAKMLARVVRIVKVGRNYGIGNVLITQEPQAVSKRALSQVNCMLIGRLQSEAATKTMRSWVGGHAKKTDFDALGDLTTLDPGELYISEPKWFGAQPRKIKVLPRITFDSSATPKMGEVAPRPGRLASFDLSELKKALASEVKEAEQDPAALRARIAALEEQLRQKVPAAAKPLKEFVYRAGEVERFEKAVENICRLGRDLGLKMSVVLGDLPKISPVFAKTLCGSCTKDQKTGASHPNCGKACGCTRCLSPAAARGEPAIAPVLRHAGAATLPPPIGRPAVAAKVQPRLPAGESRTLVAIAQHERGVTRQQLSVLAGYARSTRDRIVQTLQRHGFVETSGQRLVVTAAGRAALPAHFEPLPIGKALLQHWLQELPEGERSVLDQAVRQHPAALQRDQVTGYARSTRDRLIQTLLRRQLLDEPSRGYIRASNTLFDFASLSQGASQ